MTCAESTGDQPEAKCELQEENFITERIQL